MIDQLPVAMTFPEEGQTAPKLLRNKPWHYVKIPPRTIHFFSRETKSKKKEKKKIKQNKTLRDDSPAVYCTLAVKALPRASMSALSVLFWSPLRKMKLPGRSRQVLCCLQLPAGWPFLRLLTHSSSLRPSSASYQVV